MNEQKLVSIITPCYNGAKYLNRYADTLLKQDYHNCQLIFMDDGSTDDSGKIINSYKDQFTSKGISFEYHWHENVGLGGNVALGLKYIKGDYLIWFDQDDLLDVHSISKRVDFMESHPEYGIVRTPFKKVHDSDLEKCIGIGPSTISKEGKIKSDLFEDYLISKNMWLQPGCYMIRMKAFDDVNPDRYLFPSPEGHDWQLVLPVLYKYKCGYLDEPLFTYVYHEGSFSNAFLTESYERRIERMSNYEELIIKTIQHLGIEESDKYETMTRNYYTQRRFISAIEYGNMRDARKFFGHLKQLGHVKASYYAAYCLTYMPHVAKVALSIYRKGHN